MWVSWTLGLQSIAQTTTNKQEYQVIQVWQFFNELVANSSIIHEMLRHRCILQQGPSTFSQSWFLNSSIIVHSAHQMLKQWHRLCCTVYITRH